MKSVFMAVIGLIIIAAIFALSNILQNQQESEKADSLATFHNQAGNIEARYSNEYLTFYTNGSWDVGLPLLASNPNQGGVEIVNAGTQPPSVTISNVGLIYPDLCRSTPKGTNSCVLTFAWVDGQWTVLE
jgi:hypothetical protein